MSKEEAERRLDRYLRRQWPLLFGLEAVGAVIVLMDGVLRVGSRFVLGPILGLFVLTLGGLTMQRARLKRLVETLRSSRPRT